ncbi:uncharacterized protein LOC111616264 [Centruroides sculpturatus]|uniref:uncharacterized protein LOC111616264 n=1 Tax=Centruroides sculpturatus TaxID=218467 RepID=UPI000C6EE1EF|nr:uncharacterized protein LOC111616264 [Centruroides sculpturatus]
MGNDRYVSSVTYHIPSTINQEREKGSIEIFTDGSRVDNHVGAAFMAMQNDAEIHTEQYRLMDSCSVFQAELYAIERAIMWVTRTHVSDQIIINTDSRSALDTLQQFADTNATALNIKQIINQSGINIKMKWIKAHSGIFGNERADLLAKEAAHMTDVTQGRIPISGIKRLLRDETIAEWQDRWSYSQKGRHMFWLIPSVEERVKELNWLPMDHINCQLYTGHGNCYSYLKKIGKRQSEVCDCGSGIQDISHLLLNCYKYDKERTEILSLHHLNTGNNDLQLYNLIRDKCLKHDLRTFVRRTLL